MKKLGLLVMLVASLALMMSSVAMSHPGVEGVVLECHEDDGGDSSAVLECDEDDGDDSSRVIECDEEEDSGRT